MWWQLIETWKKLVLVGFFCLLKPGSVLQVVSAFVVSAVFSLLVGIAAPYKDASDDYFAKACSFALTMLFFFVTVLKIGVLTEQLDGVMTDELRYRFSFDAGLVSAGMVASIVGILPLAAMMAAHRLLQEAARRGSENSAASSTERAESMESYSSLRPRSTRRSVTFGERPLQERSSGPRDPGNALGTRAKALNLKRAFNLWKSRTHRTAVDESEAAVRAMNGAYRQGSPTAAAPLPSRLSQLRRSVLEQMLRRTSAPSSWMVSGASTTHNDDRSVRV